MPDVALLAISSFQKGLKDPNQLIRASALRVLSSIRVDVIVPIMEIAINTAAVDMSPYVRKCAAHALPKLYSLAPDSKDTILEVLEKLMHDRTSLVLGSVMMAFEEVCPDRLDMLHIHFRKLCNTLVDIEEWGQVVVLEVLTRYARAFFQDPSLAQDASGGDGADFYGKEESESSGSGSDSEDGDDKPKKSKEYMMDPDHRLLLRSAVPMLMSRNSGVIMAVVRLYQYAAPPSEIGTVIKALIRLLRNHREVQNVALLTIASIVADDSRRGEFRSYIKNFYIRSDDPRFIRTLKLEIMTCLANETNIGTLSSPQLVLARLLLHGDSLCRCCWSS